ncbi:MAG: cation transporter [Treponema sp.]|jgi:copper chaperone|nr:cation transporter [Treponema sp.]
MENRVLKIEGMSCEHCVKAVTGALGALSGLADISVDLKGGTASFSYDSALTSLAAIKAAIVDEGYDVIE